MSEYVDSQMPNTISTIIHHMMVASRIHFQQGGKKGSRPMKPTEQHEQKGKNHIAQNSSKALGNNKAKAKGKGYKGKAKLSFEEIERYRKDNKCFKCGEQGHVSHVCPKRSEHNEHPRVTTVEALQEDGHCKGSPLSYAWGKVREHDALILYDPGSTYNFISVKLATKIGIHDFEMGDVMKADGDFKGQEVLVTPLIGKPRLHVQGSFLSCADMYKNQLQELAQRSCFNLPSYSCIREGPDHAPRFKATVSFNGEVFESPGYHLTLRQAEHAAAELALSTLSRRGPTQSLAARILDETGVCKNLLQETAQRAGVSLPIYTTVRSGLKHLPLFTCMVEVGGRNFVGEPAKTKKQAEKNAALAAWSALKHLTPPSYLPLPPPSTEMDTQAIAILGSQHGRDEQGSLQSSLMQGAYAQRNKVRSVNVRDRNRLVKDGHASIGQYYPATQLSSASVADALGYDRYHSAYGPNKTSITSTGEISHDTAQQFLCKQSSYAGSAWPHQIATNESLAHGHSGRTYSSQGTPGSFVGSSRRQAGRHHRRHSLSGIESPALTREAMAVSRASGGGSMLARGSPHPLQIRGLPYQSLSERFELNRPSLLEELQLKDDEDEWSHRDVMSSSAQQPRHQTGRMRWQSQSERFEYRNHILPQVEEVHYWDEEEWPQDESYGMNSPVEREQGLETKSGYKEGWLRGDTLLQTLEQQKNHGYQEGWLREEIRKHSLNERRQAYRENWADGEAASYGPDEPSCSSHVSQSQNKLLNSERSLGIYVGVDERNHNYGDAFNDAPRDGKTAFGSTSIASTPSSPFSSLWAKSTQWWGSHRPSSPSSAAATLANTFGLRPASSMAPAVRVRQMVPVCSAPPPRRSDPPVSSHHSTMEHSSSLVESEANVNQLLNSLRL
ncbi:hypothetical protein L7F22_062694 [Adiantum nelumboides]|nr:hypothetical protein [Adiantum nelumboides]